jgi:peptide/nickel transport system substrate-binding protein
MEAGMGDEGRGSGLEQSGKSRRDFVRDAALFGGALVGGPAWLAAAASGEAPSPGPATMAAGKPKLGGNLIVGVSGGGTNDILNPLTWSSQIDGARVVQLCEPLVRRDHVGNLVPWLGTEFHQNAKGDQLTVKLRPGVTFHDGKPLTAADVIFTFQTVLDPKGGASQHAQWAPVIASMKAVDPQTVLFKFQRPFTDFMDFAASASLGIIPVGFDPKKPVGTGAFKFQSFTPGQQSVFARNTNYWAVDQHGGRLPYVDSVTIIDLTDDAARVNALLSGAVHAIDSVPYALLPVVQKSSTVTPLISVTGNWYPITMRVDKAPFNDPRVRKAFRLIVDRPQLVKEAYGGQARLGNDLWGIDDPLYAHHLPQRVQDIQQAKFLLKKAGRENLTVNLVTAPIENGVVQSCVVFAQQAKAAGVNVQLTKLDNTTFYNAQYLKRVFSVDWWDSESVLAGSAYTCVPGAAYPETHFFNPQFTKWYYEALGTQNLALKKEITAKMQAMLYNDGGELIPGFPDNVDAYSKKVTGFVPDRSGFNLGYWSLKEVWFV